MTRRRAGMRTDVPRGPGPPPAAARLVRAFYARPTLAVARDLLGKVLIHATREGAAGGIIVEVEAYIGEDDPACHAAPGPTPRNRPLYGPPGLAYVYLNYGMHRLFNVVTEREGFPAAVLIRALEPSDGLGLMRRRRRLDDTSDVHELCRGPGRLTQALGIELAHNQTDLTDLGGCGPSSIWIEDRGLVIEEVSWGPRVGIRVGTEQAWRCSVSGHRSVSAWRAGLLRTRGGRARDGRG